ncbi:hypothetical protein B0H11DRAFT_2250989 [Mycena galericulata]|nr:hypothetical protein B0H11DRAFT_2250989 [Mycena galericulata]
MGELLTGSIRAECLIPLPGGLSRFVTRTMLIWTRVAGFKALVHGAFRHSILPRHALYHIYNSSRSIPSSFTLSLTQYPHPISGGRRDAKSILHKLSSIFGSRIFCVPVTFALTLVLGLPRIKPEASSTFAQRQFPPRVQSSNNIAPAATTDLGMPSSLVNNCLKSQDQISTPQDQISTSQWICRLVALWVRSWSCRWNVVSCAATCRREPQTCSPRARRLVMLAAGTCADFGRPLAILGCGRRILSLLPRTPDFPRASSPSNPQWYKQKIGRSSSRHNGMTEKAQRCKTHLSRAASTLTASRIAFFDLWTTDSLNSLTILTMDDPTLLRRLSPTLESRP